VAVALPGSVGMAYTYDSDSRVTQIAYSNSGGSLGVLNYAYDANGRVVNKTGGLAATGLPSTATNAFNVANQMTTAGSASLSYDANGNLLSDGTNSYVWDARNHLASLSGANSASFVYDAEGRRESKTINGTTTQFLYDRYNPIQEQNASGTPTANLITGTRPDEYFVRTDSAGQRSFLTDTLGSTLALVDSAGTVQTTYTYDPFGNTTPGGSGCSNSFQFAGRENDLTGLYYNRARYYSPGLGRFISQDPIGFAGGMNLYGYVENDPTDLTDLFGLKGGLSSCSAWGVTTGNLFAWFCAAECKAHGESYAGCQASWDGDIFRLVCACKDQCTGKTTKRIRPYSQ